MKNPAPAAPGHRGAPGFACGVTTEPRPAAWPGKNWTGLLGDAASTVTSSLADEGARAAVTIRQQHPDVGVLLLSQVIEATFAMRLFSESPAGFGYLLKDRILDVDDFVDAVRRVGRGGTAVDPKVVSQLLRRVRPDDRLASLTDRERSVLELMAEGRSNAGIRHKLFLSPKTVEAHVHAIFTKLDLLLAPDDHRLVLAVLAFLRS